jgi:hypothetical protein
MALQLFRPVLHNIRYRLSIDHEHHKAHLGRIVPRICKISICKHPYLHKAQVQLNESYRLIRRIPKHAENISQSIVVLICGLNGLCQLQRSADVRQSAGCHICGFGPNKNQITMIPTTPQPWIKSLWRSSTTISRARIRIPLNIVSPTRTTLVVNLCAASSSFLRK